MTELEHMVRRHAFLNDVDVDKATYVVIGEVHREIMAARSLDGLFEKYFTERKEKGTR